MLRKVRFRGKTYHLVITQHARNRMAVRGISEKILIETIKVGKTKKKRPNEEKYWVYKHFPDREDNFICASLAIEPPTLIVITTLINWRPDDKS